MQKLDHPLKAELETLRTIIKGANSKVAERIKWNAPSYYYKEDFATFNLRATKHVHLVFHNAAIVNIRDDMLDGDYKDRRMAYFTTMADVTSKKEKLEKIINELVNYIDNK